MRLNPTICVMAAFTLAAVVCVAQAQPQSLAPVRVQAAEEAGPAVRFRARSAAERLATVRTVLGPQAAANLTTTGSPPFSLTVRRPYIAGRGWLRTTNASTTAPHVANEGVATFQGGAAATAAIHLASAQGRRHLVDCTVRGSRIVALAARAPLVVSAQVQVSAPNGALLSVVTGPQDTFVLIRSATAASGWFISGCEITPLQ